MPFAPRAAELAWPGCVFPASSAVEAGEIQPVVPSALRAEPTVSSAPRTTEASDVEQAVAPAQAAHRGRRQGRTSARVPQGTGEVEPVVPSAPRAAEAGVFEPVS